MNSNTALEALSTKCVALRRRTRTWCVMRVHRGRPRYFGAGNGRLSPRLLSSMEGTPVRRGRV